MKRLTIAAFALIMLGGCRSEDRDFVIYQEPRFGELHVHPPSAEQALEMKNGARLEIERQWALAEAGQGKIRLRTILDRWDYYVCQVIGLKKDGKEFVLLRFFPREKQREHDLTKDVFRVQDGGANYWTIECVSQTHSYASLQINGDA